MQDFSNEMIHKEASTIASDVIKRFVKYPNRGVPVYRPTMIVHDSHLEGLPVHRLDYVNEADPKDIRSYYFVDQGAALEFLDYYSTDIVFPIPALNDWVHITGIPFLPNMLDLNRQTTEDEDGDLEQVITSLSTFEHHVNNDNITTVEIIGAYTATMPQYSEMNFNSIDTAVDFIDLIMDYIRSYAKIPFALSVMVELEDNFERTYFIPVTVYMDNDKENIRHAIDDYVAKVDQADYHAATQKNDSEDDIVLPELKIESASVYYLPEFGVMGEYQDLFDCILPKRTPTSEASLNEE